MERRDRDRQQDRLGQHPQIADIVAAIARLKFAHDERSDNMALNVQSLGKP